jgi:hypothetical protein
MLYSKNGSIPSPQTDGSDGWIIVPDKPEPPEGKEVVWWFPPGWVIRDPKPEAQEGYAWSWSQSEEKWVEYKIPEPEPVVELVLAPTPIATTEGETLTSAQIEAVASSQIVALSSEQTETLSSLQIETLTTSQISGLE